MLYFLFLNISMIPAWCPHLCYSLNPTIVAKWMTKSLLKCINDYFTSNSPLLPSLDAVARHLNLKQSSSNGWLPVLSKAPHHCVYRTDPSLNGLFQKTTLGPIKAKKHLCIRWTHLWWGFRVQGQVTKFNNWSASLKKNSHSSEKATVWPSLLSIGLTFGRLGFKFVDQHSGSLND